MLWGLAAVARTIKGDALESGSGLSTLVLAATIKGTVHSLEHNDAWADKVEAAAKECGLTNIVIHRVPLKDGWYDYTPDRSFAMGVCDGPPRDEGDRSIMFKRCGNSLLDAVVFVDDVDSGEYWDMAVKGLPAHQFARLARFAVGNPKKLRMVA
jgi:hypothetical protein